MIVLVGYAFRKAKAIVGTFSRHCENFAKL